MKKSKKEKKLIQRFGGEAHFEILKKRNWAKIVFRLERIEAENRLKTLFNWGELPPIFSLKVSKN